ncbi:MAG: DEAD/DEAH box helicase, partial [Clostridia bacterium]|nr:DEAD/DEAH box helicase [Clostridia bacterium]
MQKPTVKFSRKQFSVTSCEIEDISGRATAVWFNQPYMAQNLKEGTDLYLYGPIEIKQGKRRLMNPTLEHEEDLSIAPVYRLPASLGLSQRSMRALMRQAIDYCISKETEVFAPDFRARHQLAERAWALNQIHFPDNEENLLQARRRLCFEELLGIQLFVRMKRKQNEAEAGRVFSLFPDETEKFIQSLPYSLTKAQKRCWDEIQKDVSSGKAMNRLVQGDVGCGKTVVAFLCMYLAVLNGGQAALMAPTDILARQHYIQLKEMFGEKNVSFLSGSLSAAQHKAELERIKTGQARYIDDTNALVQKKTEFADLSLVITDEQHRSGVAQRARHP